MAIQFSFRTAPPHLWVLENPKNEVLRTETCHGHLPKDASFPPTILVSGRGKSGGTPHCPSLFCAEEADTVITLPRIFFVVVVVAGVDGRDEEETVEGFSVVVVVVVVEVVVLVVLVVVVLMVFLVGFDFVEVSTYEVVM